MKQRIKQWIFRLPGKEPVTAIAACTPLAASAVSWGARRVR